MKKSETPKPGRYIGSLEPVQAGQDKGLETHGRKNLGTLEEARHPRYKDLYLFAPVGFVTLDGMGRIYNANQTFAQMLGTGPAQLNGGSFLHFVARNDLRALVEHLRRCKKIDGHTTTDLLLVKKEGGTVPVQLLSDSSGIGRCDPFSFPTAVIDLTQSKGKEGARNPLEKELTGFLENTSVGVKLVGPDGTILWANQAVLDLHGIKREEFVGHWATEFYADPDVVKGILERVQKAKTCHGSEAWIRCKDDSIKHVQIAANGFWRNGEFLHTCFFSFEITDQTKKIQELEGEHDGLLAILTQLDVGIVLTDEKGKITFLNRLGERILEKSHEQLLGKSWSVLFPCDRTSLFQLKSMLGFPQELRRRVPVQLSLSGGRSSWVEVEIQDNPGKTNKKVFYLREVTVVHALQAFQIDRARFCDLVGKSKQMALVFQRIQEVSPVDSTVLIEGETGTGKEITARAIHTCSPRKDKPFITVNCAGLNESLLESQLFGHRRGAFTGAMEDRKGLFESAHGGTIFLDEIGDLTLSAQTRLLRVLQEREVVRLGEIVPRKIDVRVLAATHKDLDREVVEGRFRSDLLYRIKVGRIQLPPLLARREDIPLLVASYLRQSRTANSKNLKEVSLEALRLLMEYTWPGNVRELQNVVEFAAIRCKGSIIQVDDLPPEVTSGPPKYRTGFPDKSPSEEKERLLDALKEANGNRAFAARKLGISRITLYRRMAKYGLFPSK